MEGDSKPAAGRSAAGATSDREWQTLCANARAGDSVALGELCERLRAFLTRTAKAEINGSLNPKLGASDLVQQSLLEVHQQFEQFLGRTEVEFRAWVRRILHNNTIDAARRFQDTQMRAAGREVPLELVDHAQQLVAGGKTASSVARRKETDASMLEALMQLPERRRKVVEMRYRDEMSYSEIGEQLRVSEAAARKLLSRAIDDLRTLLVPRTDGNEPTNSK